MDTQFVREASIHFASALVRRSNDRYPEPTEVAQQAVKLALYLDATVETTVRDFEDSPPPPPAEITPETPPEPVPEPEPAPPPPEPVQQVLQQEKPKDAPQPAE